MVQDACPNSWVPGHGPKRFIPEFCMVAVAVIGNSPKPFVILVFLLGEWDEVLVSLGYYKKIP